MLIFVSFIEDFFNVDRYLSVGIDASVYFFMAMSSTLLFVVRLAIQLFFGVDDGGDFDFDTGDIDGHVDSTGAFTLFSLLSILAFFMGTGWMGLTCRLNWEMGPVASAFISAGFGMALMLMSSLMMYGVRKLSHEATVDVNTALGRTGRAYLTIPGHGGGGGQVEVNVSGRRKVMSAVTRGQEIPAFTAVKVVEVRDDNTLIVEPA